MKQIKFPSELAVFTDRISDQWIAKLKVKFSKIQEDNSVPTLSDWYCHIQDLLEEEKQPPFVLWALCSKLAWIQADVEFFSKRATILMKDAKIHNDSLLLSYVGAGIAEFISVEEGLAAMEESFSQLESSKDWSALLDVATPYILLLSNNNNMETFKKVYLKVKQVFESETSFKSEYRHLYAPVQSFAFFKEVEDIQINLLDLLKIIEESQNHLNTGLLHTLMSHKEEDDSFEDHLEAAIREFRLINANNRLVIAYTNFAHYYASKAKHKEASEYLSKAFSLVSSLSEGTEGGLSIYPLIQKAWMFVEHGQLQEAKDAFNLVREQAKNYCCLNYQIKVEFGLAYVFFLQSQDDLAMTHAQNALSIVEGSKLKNPELLADVQLKYAELLTDLNRLDQVPNILETIDPNSLNKCSKVYYAYIMGKHELHRFNIGIAKKYLNEALIKVEKCSDLRPTLLITMAEGYLHEYRLSEDPKILQEAQDLIDESLAKIVDAPNRAKTQCLLAILLSAQERDEEAEELLETLIANSAGTIPRFQNLAEKLLENIRSNRVGSTNISPITNIRDVLRYLRDAKTLIESQPH